MKVAPIEEYRHLLFTGEVPIGFKLEEDPYHGRYRWVIKKGDILDQANSRWTKGRIWLVLLDTGFLCFVNNGYKDLLYKAFDYIWIGDGVCHYKVTKL